MSLVCYGEDYEYASSRLRGSLVKTVDGDPFYIKDSDMGEGLFFGKDTFRKVNLDKHLEEIDLSPIKLGYVNSLGRAGYFRRLPVRYYKQGIVGQSLAGGKFSLPVDSQELATTIKGFFPSLVDCIENVLCGEVEQLAFSRSFSIARLPMPSKKDAALEFRGRQVGIVGLSNGVDVALDTEFLFLEEMLKEALK